MFIYPYPQASYNRNFSHNIASFLFPSSDCRPVPNSGSDESKSGAFGQWPDSAMAVPPRIALRQSQFGSDHLGRHSGRVQTCRS